MLRFGDDELAEDTPGFAYVTTTGDAAPVPVR
jgi:hypothetical protein